MVDTLIGFAVCLGYILLYELNELLMGSTAFGGIASLIFLPAFVRLLGFLFLGLRTVMPLFVAAMFCVDLDLSLGNQILVASALAIGSPVALLAANQIAGLRPDLDNLTAGRLLSLSAASSIGSATAYHIALMVIGSEGVSTVTVIVAVLGDAIGTWAIIYALKLLLTLTGRLLPSKP